MSELRLTIKIEAMGSRDVFPKSCTEPCAIPYFMEEGFGYLSTYSEFYNTPAPSENIWKKFDLPNSPHSPELVLYEDCHLPSNVREHLQLESDLLDSDFEPSRNIAHLDFSVLSCWPRQMGSAAVKDGLKVELMHDCMWSGLCTDDCKQKEKEKIATSGFTSRTFPPISPSPFTSLSATTDSQSLAEDSSTVLPRGSSPLSNDHSYNRPYLQTQNNCYKTNKLRHFDSTSNRADVENYDSDTPSDFDKEVDVVTIEESPAKPKKKGLLKRSEHSNPRASPYSIEDEKLVVRKAVTLVVLPCDNSALCVAIGRNQPSRTQRLKHSKFEINKSRTRGSCSSPSSPDSEDPLRVRKEHNSMERKRRNDLRFAFQILKENVPDLKDNPKAPKVMILKKSAAYIYQLTKTSQLLDQTLKAEAKKELKLQRKLRQLQNSARGFWHN
ncbi:transcriptional regulator Myc-A-like [Limulus polyphemus]|uniref:Transcriptional regulator Myc-A-like n=1 Tax=Limulus polyphemus TaxID=6850 RepID=A0ABM1BR04_LIMPO|nr:transcriptional regulator Myc-A-like [Limulus polyphemus]